MVGSGKVIVLFILLPDVAGMSLGVGIFVDCCSRDLIRGSIIFSNPVASESLSHRVHPWLRTIWSHEQDAGTVVILCWTPIRQQIDELKLPVKSKPECDTVQIRQKTGYLQTGLLQGMAFLCIEAVRGVR